MMGIVFYLRFFAVAGVFLVVTVAAALLPSLQWWLIGGAWWLAMFPTGLSAHLEGQRRKQNERRTTIL
jgi:hypothetical protein